MATTMTFSELAREFAALPTPAFNFRAPLVERREEALIRHAELSRPVCLSCYQPIKRGSLCRACRADMGM